MSDRTTAASPSSRCAYCGLPAAYKLTVRGRVQLRTCAAHADLPSLDPAYGLTETVARGSYPSLELSQMTPTAKRRERHAESEAMPSG